METRRFRFLIVAPAMRVPGDALSGTIHAYLAMRAAFVAVLDFNRAGLGRIGTLAVPGLGWAPASAGWPSTSRPGRCAPPTT